MPEGKLTPQQIRAQVLGDSPKPALAGNRDFDEALTRKGSLQGGYTEHDISEYQRLNVPLTEDTKASWNRKRGENQSTGEQFLNGASRVIGKLPATIIQNLTTLPEIGQDFDDGSVGGNALYQLMNDWKENVDEFAPIYQENRGESFAWGDSGWWMENISGVVESAAGFVLTSYLTGAAIGKVFSGVARGGRYLSALNKTKNAEVAARLTKTMTAGESAFAQGAGGLANAYVSNHMEGYGVAMDVMKSTYDYNLKKGATEKEAKKKAADAAAMAYNINKANILLNMSSASAFVSAPKATAQILKKMTAKNTVKALGYESAQEFAEEEINHLAQKAGEAYGKGQKYGAKNVLNDIVSLEGLESGFWGAIGGAGQTALTGATNLLPTERDAAGSRISKMGAHNERYAIQQKEMQVQDAIATANDATTVTTAFKNTAEMAVVFDQLKEAQQDPTPEGKAKVAAIKDKLVDVQAYRAMEGGTIDNLRKAYRAIRDGDGKAEGLDTDPDSKDNYKKKAQEALDRIDYLEDWYMKSNQYVNSEKVFANRANLRTVENFESELKTEKAQRKASLLTAIQDGQENGTIPTSYEYNSKVNLDSTESVTGITVGNSTVDLLQAPIVFDENGEVVNDPNIPQDVQVALNAQVAGMKAAQELELADSKLSDIQENKKNLEKAYNYMTSVPVQQALINQEKLDAEKRASSERAVKKREAETEENIKRNNALASVETDNINEKGGDVKTESSDPFSKTEPVSETEASEVYDDADLENDDPDLSAFNEALGDETGDTEIEEGDTNKGGETVSGTSNEKVAFVRQAKRETNAAKTEYTEVDNKNIPAIQKKASEKSSKTVQNQFKTNDGEIQYGRKPAYAVNLAAYLARDYKEVFTKDKDGKTVISKESINNELRDNYDTSLSTEVFEGTDMEIRVLGEGDSVDDIEMYNPAYLTDKSQPQILTWGELKQGMTPQQINDSQPIGIFKAGASTPSAYIHTTDWIKIGSVNPKGPVSLAKQKEELSEWRRQLIANGTTKSKVVSKSPGNLVFTHDGKFETATDALSDPKLKFAIVHNNEFTGGKDSKVNKQIKEVEVLNPEVLKNNGMFVVMVPMEGKQADYKEGDKVMAIPLRRKLVSPEYAESIGLTIQLWYHTANDSLTDPLKELDSKLEDDFSDFTDVVDYLEAFTTVHRLNNADPTGDISRLRTERGNTTATNLVGVDSSGIYFAEGGSSTVHYIKPGMEQIKFDEKINKLVKMLQKTHIQFDRSTDQNSELGLPILKTDGTVTSESGTYAEFMKKNSDTNLVSYKDNNGKTIYTVQHTIGLDQNTATQEAEVNNTKVASQEQVDAVIRQQDAKDSLSGLGLIKPRVDVMTSIMKKNGYKVEKYADGAVVILNSDREVVLEDYAESESGMNQLIEGYFRQFVIDEKITIPTKDYTDAFLAGTVEEKVKEAKSAIVKNVDGYALPAMLIQSYGEKLKSYITRPTRQELEAMIDQWGQDKVARWNIAPKEKAKKKTTQKSEGKVEVVYDGQEVTYSNNTYDVNVQTGVITNKKTGKVISAVSPRGKAVLKQSKTQQQSSPSTEVLFEENGIVITKEDLEAKPKQENVSNQKQEDITENIGGIEHSIDIFSTGETDDLLTDDSDDLVSPEVYESIEEAIKDFYVPGLTPSQTKDLTVSLANSLNSIVNNSQDKKKVSINKLLDQFKGLYSRGASQARKANAPTADALTSLVENWPTLQKLVTNRLQRLQTVKVQEEGDTENLRVNEASFTQSGADLEKSNHDDGASLSVDAKKTASANLKRFLTNIKDVRQDGTVKKGFAGAEKFIPFDTAWNTMSGLLAGSRPDLQSQLAELKSYAEAMPWLNQVINELQKEDTPLTTKAEFSSIMAKHNTDMRAVLWSVDDKGNYKLEVAPVNANAVGKEVQRKWVEGVKDKMFVADPQDLTDFIIDKEKAKAVISEFASISKSKEPEAAKEWLESIGIEMSPKAWSLFSSVSDQNTGGLYYSNKDRTWDQMFSPGGVFSNINEAVKDHMNNDTGLSQGKIISNPAVKALANLEATNNPQHFANSYRDGEDKTRSAYTANKYLINRLRELKADPELVKNLLDIPFNEDSNLLNELNKKANGEESLLREVFNVFYMNTLVEKDSKRKGVTAKNMTEAQLEQTRLGYFQNTGTKTGGRKGDRIMNLTFPTTSDKTNPMGVTLLAHETVISKKREGDTETKIGSASIQAIYDQVVMPEIKRIQHVQANRGEFNLKGYEEGGEHFLFMPVLNTIKELWDDNNNLVKGITVPTAENESLRNLIKKKIEETINAEIQQKKEEWSTMGIGKANNKGYVGLDSNYLKAVKTKGDPVGYAAADYIVNSMLGNANIFQAFIGDPAVFFKAPAFVKEAIKVAKKGDPENAEIFTLLSKAIFDNIGKRLAGDVAPGTELALQPGDKKTYTQAFLKDAEVASAYFEDYVELLGELAGDYGDGKINAADAQEFTTLEEHLFVMKGLGQVTATQYNKILDYYNEQGDDFRLDGVPDGLGKIILQPMKPVYVGNHIETDSQGNPVVDGRVYIKSSSFPLLPEFTKGTDLDVLRKTMNDKGIDRVAFESAVKVGMTKTAMDPWTPGTTRIDESVMEEPKTDKDGNPIRQSTMWEGAFENQTKTLDRANFRIQQEIPYKDEKKQINDGSQQRKLLFSNLMDVGGFEYKNEKGLKGRDLNKKYMSLYEKLFKDSYEDFMKTVTVDNTVDGEINVRKFRDILKKEAISQNYSMNDILALALNEKGTDFKVPLWSNMSANKFEALLNGIVDKRVRAQKVRGNSFVLGTELGSTKIKTDDEFNSNDTIVTKDYDPEVGLKARDKDGYAQILVSNKMKDQKGRKINLSKYTDADGLLDMTKMPQEVLEGFGYRIPTQGLNSMAKVRIVGFLPDAMGDLIIAPKEWVVQMGSDFDVDKIYINFHNTVEENGVLKKATDGREGLENDILDVHLSVMNNKAKEVQSQIATPLAFGWLKGGKAEGIDGQRTDLANEMVKIKPEDKSVFNPLSPTYQRNRYMNGVAGKAGTGVLSLDSTLNAALQDKDVTLEGVDTIDLTFGDEVSTGNLSNIYTLRTADSKFKGERRYKSDVIAGYQSAAVDNENEQILNKLNINGETFAALGALNQLGFEEDVAMMFINQPIIEQYVKEVKNQRSLGDFSRDPEDVAYDKMLEKWDEAKNWGEDLDILQENKQKAAKGYDFLRQQIIEQGKDYRVQLALLDKFRIYDNIGQELKRLQQAINGDGTSGISPHILENMEKENRVLKLKKEVGDDVTEVTIVGAEALIGDYEAQKGEEGTITRNVKTPSGLKEVTIKPETINGYATVYGLMTANTIADKFFRFGPKQNLTQAAFKEVERHTGESKDLSSVAKKRMRIWKSLKKYLYSEVFSEDPQSSRLRLFYDTENNDSLALRMKEYQKMPMFRNNTFIQRVESYLGKGVRPSTVAYNASAVENEDETEIYAGFINLVSDVRQITDDYTTRDLANDLVEAAFLEGGIQEAQQYVRYIPSSYILKGSFIDKISNLNFKSSSALGYQGQGKYYDVSQFMRQYMQHNPWEAVKATKDDMQEKLGSDFMRFSDSFMLENSSDIGGEKQAPVFIAVENPKSNKKHDLYRLQLVKDKDGNVFEGYIKESTLGTRGMEEWSKGRNVSSTIGTQGKISYNKKGPVNEADIYTLSEKDAPAEDEFEKFNDFADDSNLDLGPPVDMSSIPFPGSTGKPGSNWQGMEQLDPTNPTPKKVPKVYGGQKNVNTVKKSKFPIKNYGMLEANDRRKKASTEVTQTVLQNIRANSKSPMNQYLAAQLAPILERMGTASRVADGKKELPIKTAGRSQYASRGKSNLIIINQYNEANKSDDTFEHSFLHEAVHQATRDAVDIADQTGDKSLNKIEAVMVAFDDFITKNEDNLNLSDQTKFFISYIQGKQKPLTRVQKIQEFTAFAMSNPEVQSLLKLAPAVGNNSNMLDKLMNIWADLLKAMGVTDSDNLLVPTLDFVVDMAKVKAPTTRAKASPNQAANNIDALREALNVNLGDDSGLSSESNVQENADLLVTLSPLAEAGLINVDRSSIAQAVAKSKIC